MAGAAARLESLAEELLGGRLPIRLVAWDGSQVGPSDAAAALVVRRRRAARRLLWAPSELGLARAYVAGDLDVEGDLFAALALPAAASDLPGLRLNRWRALATMARLGAIGPPPPPPPEEARVGGRRHTRRRDRQAISHHYDVGNEFYGLVLGDSMTYSCAYWADPPSDGDDPLSSAQLAKCDLVSRKLGLRSGQRLLDIGCGWGTMVLHAARQHGVTAVGVTISSEQADLARKRIADAGLADHVEIRLQDYRDVDDGPYDAISSIGMAEHVGGEHFPEYIAGLHRLLRPGGRLLNHQITATHTGEVNQRSSFMNRYIFPNGELLPLGVVVGQLEAGGFEVRDVESLREHYALTLRAWAANLERHWDDAVRLSSPGRARAWRLYMAGAALSFEAGRVSIHQVLGVKPDAAGKSGVPLTRTAWLGLNAPAGPSGPGG